MCQEDVVVSTTTFNQGASVEQNYSSSEETRLWAKRHVRGHLHMVMTAACSTVLVQNNLHFVIERG